MNFHKLFAEQIIKEIDHEMEKEEVLSMIETPKHEQMGDLALPCFQLAKRFRNSPQAIAEEISKQINTPLFEKVEALSGYVNVFLNKKEVTAAIMEQVLSKTDQYGSVNIGKGDVVSIDFSSPNIAKPFSMGHLRSTVIGNSLALIFEKCGYKPVRINHIGDWGTQFGKLIVAYQKWGNEDQVQEAPIQSLFRLYVQFHEEAEVDPSLNEQGREEFKRLEDGDGEMYKLWKWFREESLKEFKKIYDLLGIQFNSFHGEAFYNNKMDKVIALLEEKNLLQESDGAKVVPLDDTAPCLIKKSNGTTLYATRDLAAAIYRQETYRFVKSLYVVGNEQSLHFKQLFKVLEKMGYDWYKGLTHIPFGMMLQDGKKMSTRKGKTVLLEEVLQKAIKLARQGIEERNTDLLLKDEVAQQVGIGAVVFHDLKNYRMNDIEFSLNDMLRFEGETGPYVQYTHARASSLLRKANYQADSAKFKLEDAEAWPVVRLLIGFPDIVQQAMETFDPAKIARYVIDLSKAFNKYYGSVKILHSTSMLARLTLVYSVKIVLQEGLRLLGIQAPEEM